MKIEESIGRFNIRKTLRFEMRPVGKTADFLAGHLESDEERAASLNTVKAAIEAEHRKWAGRVKADVEKTCPLLRAPRRRKPSRNYWFDHSPFRVMFGNRTVGMNWTKEDFNASRTFLLTDGERIIIGITPRESKFTPYGLPDAANTETSYLLYEESEAQHPKMRAVPKELVDFPASRGAVYLFELSGRALRSRTNLNALYLRALLSPANFSDPTFRLRRGAEFFVRKGADIPADGKPDHFRQRFNEDKFFVSLPVSLNSQMAAINQRETAYGDLSQFIASNPTAKFIMVGRDYAVSGESGEDNGAGASRPRMSTNGTSSRLAGELARRAVEEDAYVIFDPKTPKRVLEAVERKFNYIVIRGRDPLEVGGVLRGYQIPHRLFVGDLDAARKSAEEHRALYEAREHEKEAEAKLRAEKAAKKAAGRELYAQQLLIAQEKRRKMEELVNSSKPIALLDPIFAQGRYTFHFTYKTSDNVRHEDTCRADERDEVFQKLRTVKIRPMKVWCDDLSSVALAKEGPARDIATRLKQLDALKSQGLITEAEYNDKRTKILAEL